jgi:hypothetical protein
MEITIWANNSLRDHSYHYRKESSQAATISRRDRTAPVPGAAAPMGPPLSEFSCPLLHRTRRGRDARGPVRLRLCRSGQSVVIKKASRDEPQRIQPRMTRMHTDFQNNFDANFTNSYEFHSGCSHSRLLAKFASSRCIYFSCWSHRVETNRTVRLLDVGRGRWGR